MPEPSLLCTAPPPPKPTPRAAEKPRGNPTLHLARRCGARTRAGCPCQAPAIRGKQRCRMHGGRSTGPRTPEGLDRIRAARTIHGGYGAEWRARNRHAGLLGARTRVFVGVFKIRDRLPPDLAARFLLDPPELRSPPYPGPLLTAAQDRALALAEKAALAPWRQAIALLRQAGPSSAAVRPDAAVQEAHAPEPPPPPTRRRRGLPPPAPQMQRQDPLHQSSRWTGGRRRRPPDGW